MTQHKKLLYIGNKLAVHGKAPTTADTLPPLLEKEGYNVIVASSKHNRFLRLLDIMRTLCRSRDKLDIVLIDVYSTWNFYYAVVIARMCSIFHLPYIPILHGGNLPKRLKENKRLSQKLFSRAKMNVAPSKFILQAFQNEGYDNLVYIPNNLQLDHYPFKQREEVLPRLLWVRAFAGIYNPLLAVEAVELLKKEGYPVELCMVGPEKDGSMKRCLDIAAQLHLPIRFTGYLSKMDWISLSKDYDIFISTTNFDNMPVSIMEAMALGFPVISTDVGGMPFLIDSESNGILVPSNSAQEFAAAIIRLCEDKLLTKNISSNARKDIEQFDWHEIKIRWHRLLDDCHKN